MTLPMGAVRNMLDMARGHAALERRDAQEQTLKALLARLSDHTYGTQKVQLPDEGTGRPINF